jgi:hypothetical protein
MSAVGGPRLRQQIFLGEWDSRLSNSAEISDPSDFLCLVVKTEKVNGKRARERRKKRKKEEKVTMIWVGQVSRESLSLCPAAPPTNHHRLSSSPFPALQTTKIQKPNSPSPPHIHHTHPNNPSLYLYESFLLIYVPHPTLVPSPTFY